MAPDDLNVWAASECGHVRTNNEDAWAISGAPPGLLARWRGRIPAAGGWALVADGMGGHSAGEVASALAIGAMRETLPGLSNAADVAAALQETNARLYAAMSADPALLGMGTTIAGALLQGDRALLFNVGDSRIYLHSHAGLSRISEDHGVGHMLTQCLGGSFRPLPLEPCIRAVPLQPGARLLLCSDGLTDMLADAEIARILSSTPADPANALVEAALDAGGVDNVTVIVLDGADPAP